MVWRVAASSGCRMQIACRLSRADAGGDVIRRRWNNLHSMKASRCRDDPHHGSIVRSGSPGLKRLRSHQNALRAREAITGVTSLERTPASILYNTIPCANTMLAITPIRKRRFNMTFRIRMLNPARALRTGEATWLIDARTDLCLQCADT